MAHFWRDLGTLLNENCYDFHTHITKRRLTFSKFTISNGGGGYMAQLRMIIIKISI